MLEDRYEIRGKLGHGGLGTVYRAWDRSLRREVALKRIRNDPDDGGEADEAARQMTRETGALSALQHPNIVTIYDIGRDEDGPYVVMELIGGDTIDAVVERAPLTFADFREFAGQVQEGLIAGQDLGLIHRDLKPSNLMLNWLPSGKFQVKIVDFGLAKFSSGPSRQTLDQNDSVYGSIFFMAPEQFERGELDARADMYAIGAVYYFALTGEMPFQGDTGPQVMAAHLEHRVVPLADKRPDVPQWAADWVMWHINRQPGERPENAREALASFIELDSTDTQAMSQESPESPPAESAEPETPKRPRLIIPGTEPAAKSPPAETEQAAQPTTGPQSAQPATGPQAVPSPPKTQTAPQPLQPPQGSPPSVHTTGQQTDAGTARAAADAPTPAPPVHPSPPSPTQVPTSAASPPSPAVPVRPTPAPAGPGQMSPQPPAGAVPPPGAAAPPSAKTGMGNTAKGAIGGILAIIVVTLTMIFLNIASHGKDTERYNELVEKAAVAGASELPVNERDVEILLNSIRAGSNRERETVYKALAIAKATDGTNVAERIAAFATTEALPVDIRVALLRRVVPRRSDPSVVPYLIEFARSSVDESAAATALAAVSELGGDEQIPEFLDVIQFTDSTPIRKAAEDAAAEAIRNSENRDRHAESLIALADNAAKDEVRRTAIRLLGHTGGDKARERVIEALENEERPETLAALRALQSWPDESVFGTLIELVETAEDEDLRRRGFDAAYGMLMDRDREIDEFDREDFWKMLAREAKLEREQITVINGLAQTETSDWALSVIEYFADEAERDRVIDQAEKAILHIRDRAKLKRDD